MKKEARQRALLGNQQLPVITNRGFGDLVGSRLRGVGCRILDGTWGKLETSDGTRECVINDGFTPYQDANACEKCQEITVGGLVSGEGFYHWRKYGELRDSVLEGCKLCAIILLAVEKGPASQKGGDLDRFRKGRWSGLWLRAWCGKKERLLRSDYVEIRLRSRVGFEPDLPEYEDCALLGILGMYGDHGKLEHLPIAYQMLRQESYSLNQDLIAGRRIRLEFNTTERLQSFAQWIRDGMSAEDEKSAPPLLPTRVIL